MKKSSGSFGGNKEERQTMSSQISQQTGAVTSKNNEQCLGTEVSCQ
jgi:hypothetical protein